MIPSSFHMIEKAWNWFPYTYTGVQTAQHLNPAHVHLLQSTLYVQNNGCDDAFTHA